MTRPRDIADSINRINSSAADATAVTVDSSENVSIGTTSGFGKLNVKNSVQLYNDSVDGTAHTNATIGEISSQVRNFGTNISTARFSSIKFCVDPSTYYFGDIRFFTNSVDGTASAGTERMRILSGGGLTFNGDTAAANALNDYQEGTWTAGFKATVTNPTVNSITNSTGVYTKIGDLVFIQIYTGAINISNAGTGSAYIDGLPFSPSDSPTSAVQYSPITFTHTNALTGQIQNGYVARAYSGFFPILEGTVNGTTWTTGATLYLMAGGVYRTDA